MRCFHSYERTVQWLRTHKYHPIKQSPNTENETWVNGRHTLLVRWADEHYYVINADDLMEVRA